MAEPLEPEKKTPGHERAGDKWTCRRCGKKVAGHVPKGGDGGAHVLRRHNRTGGGRCDSLGDLYTFAAPEKST